MEEAHAALREHDAFAPLIEEHGPLTLEADEEPFARLVVSIINQQLSTQSAAAIRDRLFDRFDVTPATMLSADEEALREVGLSKQKVSYVRNIAAAFDDGSLSRAQLAAMDDEAVVDALTDVKGIGTWTAKMALISILGREDVFPVEDLGIRKGMAILHGFEEDDRTGMVEHAEQWSPYRSYASLYLWRAYDA